MKPTELIKSTKFRVTNVSNPSVWYTEDILLYIDLTRSQDVLPHNYILVPLYYVTFTHGNGKYTLVFGGGGERRPGAVHGATG